MRLRPGNPRVAAAGAEGVRIPRPASAVVALASPLVAALASWPAAAQPPPPLPGIIERVAPVDPPALGPPLLPPEPAAATGPGEARRVAIAGVVILGAQALPEAGLRPLVAPLEGRAPTLAEIEAARLAVLRAYRAAGFPYVAVAARLVAAAGDGAELRLLVTEGHIAEILLDGASIGPAERQVRRFLDPLVGQRPLSQAALERALLLASDIPGVVARGVLRPLAGGAGAQAGEPGALQLLVQLSRRPVSGFASLDNRGHAATGAWQGLLVGQLNALTGFGERTEVALLRSEGNGQGFVQLVEEIFLGGSGLRLRAHAGAGRSAPGAPLATLGYAGETQVAGLGLSYPVIRSRTLNLGVSAQAEAFESLVETRPAPGEARRRQSRDAVRAVRLGADLAVQDASVPAPAAATTTLQLRVHQGIAGLGAAEGGTSRTGSEAGFLRIGAEVVRVQPLALLAEAWLLAVQGTLAGQWSDDVLPAAERFYLGGARLGRGFHAGQAAGDRAVAGSIELQLGRVLETGETGAGGVRLGTQFYLFRDEGRGFDNGPAGADQRLASWGGGVRLQIDERWQIEAEGVRRLTRRPDGAGVAPLDETAVFGRVLLRF